MSTGMFYQIRPMGAKSVKAEKLEAAYRDPSWIAEPKMDGSRYIAQVVDGEVRLTSRRESVKGGMVEKTENVPHIIKELSKLPNCILDGEIDNRDFRDFHRVQGIMGSLPERAHEMQISHEDKLVFKVFDILSINNTTLRPLDLYRRHEILDKILGTQKYVLLVPRISGEENKRKMFGEMIEDGMEGIILKNLHAAYKEDSRPSDTWYKVKLTQTFDGFVVGYKKGKGKYSDTLGALTIAQYVNGEKTTVAEISGMNDTDRRRFQKRVDSGDIGWVVEFKAQEPEKNSFRYRHPRFLRERKDKSPKQCIYGQV